MIEAKVFQALANPTRISIVVATFEEGELSVSEIASKVGCLQPVASRELTTLKNAGVVVSRREGPRTFYRLSDRYRPLVEVANAM